MCTDINARVFIKGSQEEEKHKVLNIRRKLKCKPHYFVARGLKPT